ncbi:MAG: GNAT family N-acetyltransferase [Betaproteobacteria bacterium]
MTITSLDHALDNPVWSCLTTRHAHLAQGGDLARRYPADISSIAAVRDVSPANVAALESLVPVGDAVALGGAQVPSLPANWETLHEARMLQMIRSDRSPLPEDAGPIAALAAADVDEMLALVELTRPGPFRSRTVTLGTYVGIRDEGRLVAMAGERMWIGDHREVSAVCTHPDAQGRGYARSLMANVVNRMLRAGQTPFLHVESGNATAIAVYRRLGFIDRAEFALRYAQRAG